MFPSAAQPLDSTQPFLTEAMADSQKTNRMLERSEGEKTPPTIEHDSSHQEAPMQMPGRVNTARELQKSPTISPLARSDIGPGWIDRDESLADYQISDKRQDSLWGERYLQDPRSTADQSGSSSQVSSAPTRILFGKVYNNFASLIGSYNNSPGSMFGWTQVQTTTSCLLARRIVLGTTDDRTWVMRSESVMAGQ